MNSPNFFSLLIVQNEKVYSNLFRNSRPKLSATSHTDSEENTATILKPKQLVKRPPLYKVILLNDDFTPMEFVILVLKRFFSKSQVEAEKIMLEVHNKGAGIAGLYTFEVAETKVFTVNEFSRRQKHPLKCIMEKDTSERSEDA